jgi:vesicle coat complex subunit
LISITPREQVANIRGKAIYSIKDVTLIPLSSQAAAEEAILSAGKSTTQNKKTTAEDTEESDIEDDAETASVNEETSDKAAEALDAPDNTVLKKSTTFVKDVVQDKGLYGRFANKWFSKNGWTANGRKRQGMSDRRCSRSS